MAISKKYELTIVEVNSILSAIPKEWKRKIKGMKIEEMEREYESLYQEFLVREKPVRWAYRKLNQKDQILSKSHKKLMKGIGVDIDFEEYIEAVLNIKRITNHPKIRSFQYRMLQGAIILNKHPYRWKIMQDNLCTFCKKEKNCATSL